MSAPFGIELGSPTSELEVLESFGGGRFVIAPPRPHPAFETYVVESSDRLGVVWVKAIGFTMDNDAYGNGVQLRHEELRGQLSKRYGSPEMVDWIVSEALWKDSREWVMSLTQNERFYYARWERPSIPSDLESVYLGVGTDGNFASWLVLEYASAHMKEVEAARQDDLADLL